MAKRAAASETTNTSEPAQASGIAMETARARTSDACGRRLWPKRMSRAQMMVEFALMAPIVMVILLVGVQFAMIGQAALAVSQGSSALARYAAVNGKTAMGTANGNVTLNSAMLQLLSPTIQTKTGGNYDLTVTIASYSGTSTTTTGSPGYTDRCVITLTYNTNSKLVLPNPFFWVHFPTSVSASDSQMYE